MSIRRKLNAAKVRKLKTKRLLTWPEIAKACRVHQDTIDKWLAGRQTPHADTLDELAAILQTTPDDLLIKDDPKEIPIEVRDAFVSDGWPTTSTHKVNLWFKTSVSIEDVPALLKRFEELMPKPLEYGLEGIITGSTIIKLRFYYRHAIFIIELFIVGYFADLQILELGFDHTSRFFLHETRSIPVPAWFTPATLAENLNTSWDPPSRNVVLQRLKKYKKKHPVEDMATVWKKIYRATQPDASTSKRKDDLS